MSAIFLFSILGLGGAFDPSTPFSGGGQFLEVYHHRDDSCAGRPALISLNTIYKLRADGKTRTLIYSAPKAVYQICVPYEQLKQRMVGRKEEVKYDIPPTTLYVFVGVTLVLTTLSSFL